jgi:hypothetical protein
MAKRAYKPKPNFVLYAIVGILLIVAIVFASLYAQSYGSYSSLRSKYSVSQINYTSLQSIYNAQKLKYTALESNYSSLRAQLDNMSYRLSNLSNAYNMAEYKLSHPFILTLYNETTVNISPETNVTYYNATYGESSYQYIPGVYNFSFSVPSNGYILFNETNTGIPNNFTYGYFKMYLSSEKPYSYTTASGASSLDFDSYIAPYTVIGPQSSETYEIPVHKGTNYVIFYNNNLNQGITMTFNMQFVGSQT